MTEVQAQQVPEASLREEAMELLVDAVRSLSASIDGRPPTASEVLLEMRRRTYGGFQFKAIGFKRFREFLWAAAEEGLIRIDDKRPGDFAVIEARDSSYSTGESRYIRPDLWRAFVDWDPRMARYFDLAEKKAVMLPSEAVPFEPSKFRELRKEIEENRSRFVEIHPIQKAAQIEWMRDFAKEVAGPTLGPNLADALAGPNPVRTFIAILRRVPRALAAWHSYLGLRVRQEIERWRDGLPEGDSITIDDPDVEHDADALTVERLRARLADLPDPLASHVNYGSGPSGLAELRARLHMAIDRMPEDELRMLRVPVGYLFER